MTSPILDIEIMVNWPRLNAGLDNPIEALIRKNDGTIIHNVFADTPREAFNKSVRWINASEYFVGVITRLPDTILYERAFDDGGHDAMLSR